MKRKSIRATEGKKTTKNGSSMHVVAKANSAFFQPPLYKIQSEESGVEKLGEGEGYGLLRLF